ncbi:DoxX family protein [Aestuariicella sp. G3-2]|uniref:DoxX family protein n=1 Tax=Pseudomaricurvus albidus TaxID=2842452 RepID=UPI001C0AC5D3|nr:DoxX family protein [Aestuariicella albida]MBU3071354.1 DoxX family protein [Aestuariicella albida]
MKNLLRKCYQPYHVSSFYLSKLHHLVALLSRLYLAKVFFSAGWVKLRDWDTTLFLFEEEYQVPLLPYEAAAYLGTFGEILFPLLLAIGLTTRFSALALSVVNVVAVISLAEIAPAALYLHIIWGLLLAHLAIYGSGALSLDNILKRFRLKNSFQYPAN